MGLKRILQTCAILLALSPGLARGQDIGVVAPRTLVTTAFNNVTCAAGLTFVVPDRGLNVHVILWDVTAGVTAIQVQLEGSFDNATWFSIIFAPGSGVPHGGTFSAVYLPFVRIRIVSCTGAGNITLNYSGTWSLQVFAPFPTPFQPFACTSGAVPINLTGAGTSVAVASTSATTAIHVCTVSFSLSAASNVTFVYGTGVTCGTGTTAMTGVYQNVLTYHNTISTREDFATAPGNDLCITLSAAVTLGGYISYVEF